MKLFGRWTIKQVAVAVLLVGLLAEGLAAAVFLKLEDFSLLDQGDTIEYVTIADNLIEGNGYSAEMEPPYRPTASRVPGMLVTNIPLRYFLADSDTLVTLVGKLILLAAALFMVMITRYFVGGDWPWVAGVVLIFIPTVAYYGINPYSTGPLYVFSYTALYAGVVLVLRGHSWGALLVGLASLYALSLRPAALFTLAALAVASLGLGALLKDRVLRRKLWAIGAAVAIGGATIYLAWCYRNLVVFDAFRYSSVEGFNLLHFNAYGMKPYLGDEADAEIDAAIEKLPLYIHRYHGPDQMEISEQQGDEGMRLIRKYPAAFVVSHLVGSLKCFFLFDVELLDRFAGGLATYVVAAAQGVLTLLALIGLVRYWRTADTEHRVLIGLIAIAGAVSILSGGMLGQPRFRFPGEPVVVIGLVLFIRDYLQARMGGPSVES